jgi:hypothetical protein
VETVRGHWTLKDPGEIRSDSDPIAVIELMDQIIATFTSSSASALSNCPDFRSRGGAGVAVGLDQYVYGKKKPGSHS